MIFGVDKASCNAGCIGCETSRNFVFRARPPAGCRPQHICGACLRPTCRKAGCIRDRNTHQSGDIRFGRLRQGYIATRAKWSVEQLQRQPTRFAIRQSFRYGLNSCSRFGNYGMHRLSMHDALIHFHCF